MWVIVSRNGDRYPICLDHAMGYYNAGLLGHVRIRHEGADVSEGDLRPNLRVSVFTGSGKIGLFTVRPISVPR